MKDFRKKEHRREAFIKWFGWSVEIEDCDPAIYLTNYFFNRFEFNTEQKYWLCWLYGTTYQWPTSYVIWNEFPDMELVGLKRLNVWNDLNYKRLRYQVDTKWNKGHLPEQFKSYRDWLEGRTQDQKFRSLIGKSPTQNFQILWSEITTRWFKFGRYSAWFYLQVLKHCCGIDLEPNSLMFKDYSGSRSHRNGFCYATGKDDWVDQKLTAKQYAFLERSAADILRDARNNFPHVAEKMDYFAMETALCSFKKLFRTRQGRYLGYYLDRQAEEIKKVTKDDWEGIEWKPLWDARNETLLNKYNHTRVDKTKMKRFVSTGQIKQTENGTMSTSESAAVWVELSELKPWTDNPRFNESAIPKVVESIKRFGFASPIIARKADNTIIAGHTRFAAAEKLGLERVPVRFMDLDPADAKLLALADNKLGEISAWDFGKMKDVFEGLGDISADLQTIGFNEKELEGILFADYDFNFEGDAPQNDEYETDPEDSTALKIVQIYFDEDDYVAFQKNLDFLAEHLGTDNNTDTIIESVKKLVVIHQARNPGTDV